MPARIPRSLGWISELAPLSVDGRLGIPADVRKVTEWLASSRRVLLIAELVEPGLIRLFPRAAVLPQLEATKQRLEQRADGGDALAVFFDRWRPVVYYPSNGSVLLGEIIAVFLLKDHEHTEAVFVEARGTFVGVMTLPTRNARLARLAAQTFPAEPPEEDGE